jgi:hypothetical protein
LSDEHYCCVYVLNGFLCHLCIGVLCDVISVSPSIFHFIFTVDYDNILLYQRIFSCYFYIFVGASAYYYVRGSSSNTCAVGSTDTTLYVHVQNTLTRATAENRNYDKIKKHYINLHWLWVVNRQCRTLLHRGYYNAVYIL